MGHVQFIKSEKPSQIEDLAGKRFHALVVKNYFGYHIYLYEGKKHIEHVWECICDCGKKSFVRSGPLLTGRSKSCGCYKIEWGKRKFTRHGMSHTPTWSSWHAMMMRCHNPNGAGYNVYGARGIVVCERWHKFGNFFEDMGVRPDGMSIERLDNQKGYEPANCVWADRKTQAKNKIATRKVSLNGMTRTVPEWADIYGISYKTLQYRLKKGWDFERAVLTPIRKPMTYA